MKNINQSGFKACVFKYRDVVKNLGKGKLNRARPPTY